MQTANFEISRSQAPAWERTVLPALPAGCEAEPCGQRVMGQNPVTWPFAEVTRPFAEICYSRSCLRQSALAPCRTWACVLAGLLAAGGCSRPEGQGGGTTAVTRDTLATARAEAYERPERRLTTAAFVRQSLDTKLARRLVYLAPLIMQEPWDPAAETPTFQRFGAVRLDQDGQPRVETDRLTVYFFPSRATLGGREHEQWTYVWFYPPGPGSRRIRFRGFRLTLAEDGLPIIWEVAANDATLQLLWVSAALAADAGQAWGPPLPGRRYAIEPPLEARPNVVVVRLLSDGPQPMGPYVYLEGRDLTLTSLLCRCSPAQVDRWFVETMYEPVRLRDLGELGLNGQIDPQLGLSPDPAWLDKALRLPPRL